MSALFIVLLSELGCHLYRSHKGRDLAHLNTVRENELQATPSSFKSMHIRTEGSAS